MKQILLFCCLFLFLNTLSAQVALATKKNLEAGRIDAKIALDGSLDEAAWANAAEASDFLFQWPTPGLSATEKSVVKILYDDHAIYIGAQLFDSAPDSIRHRLTKRDELENTDWFAVTIDTYQDGQNAVQMGVSPDNVQFDSKFSLANANSDNGNPDGEDPTWDAVWYSATHIGPNGWTVELEIPYSALRFPKKDLQQWNLNFTRSIQRKGETDCWNEIKAEISGALNQMGTLNGIKGIKAPLRLSATPFVAAYADNRYKQPESPTNSWNFPFNLGMDLKYGINQAFTLDATIVPDFGQVRSDNYVLNLSPFEQRFDENRPFFTEGTELFNKGGLFYSRRVGARPIHYWDVYDQMNENTEEITNNPNRSRLLNASKLSGRTNTGLGIGVFNAVEAPMEATVKNLETGETRTIQTAPLTNKSIFVLDQNLKNNSSLTFINTAVMRNGADPDASVSAVLFKVKNKAQSYATDGKIAVSSIRGVGISENGYTAHLNVEKTNGNFLWGANTNIESDKYNPNDLGFLYSPNEKSGVAWVNYSQYKPVWKLNNFWTSLWTYQERLYRPDHWVISQIGYNFGGNTKKFQNFGVNTNIAPAGMHDYFEPRVFDFQTYYTFPAFGNVNIRFSSDNRKKMLFFFNSGAFLTNQEKRNSISINAGVRWRTTDRMTLNLQIGAQKDNNNEGWTWSDENALGYADLPTDNILIGRRNIDILSNELTLNYSFSSKTNLNIYARHYWQKVEYNSFQNLLEKGQLESSSYTGKDANGKALNDITANYFNVDMVFTWRFAPGSDLLLVYKNGIYNELIGPVIPGYFQNVGELGKFAGSNSFSLKVLYFLDYERVSTKLK